jgi:antitoxin CcdA
MPLAAKKPGIGATRTPARRAANVTLPEPLLREARELGVSLSQACERGLAAAVAEARARKWLDDNQAAIEAWNDYVETNGLPLAEFRQF